MSKVIKQFTDKYTRERYQIGSEYEGSFSRILELYEKGYVEKPTEPKTETNEEPLHVGAGYYELPNGEKIRGKKKAYEAFNNLKK
jgi:hypothetical protein